MAKMSLSSYVLILTFSLLSQGIFLSASKSIRNLEDDMVFNTFRLGKAFQKEDTAEKSAVAPIPEQYKNDDSSFMNDEETKNSKNAGSKHNFLNHGLPLNLAGKPYLALKGSVAFPAENGVQNTESTQEKREMGDEENSAKFPIGRRDFDNVCWGESIDRAGKSDDTCWPTSSFQKKTKSLDCLWGESP